MAHFWKIFQPYIILFATHNYCSPLGSRGSPTQHRLGVHCGFLLVPEALNQLGITKTISLQTVKCVNFFNLFYLLKYVLTWWSFNIFFLYFSIFSIYWNICWPNGLLTFFVYLLTPKSDACLYLVVETRTTSMHRLSHYYQTQRYNHGLVSTGNKFGSGFLF